VEHYEIAAYGSLKTWAAQLGEEEAAQLLEKTLDEEKEADQKLSQIAESNVNAAAVGPAKAKPASRH
jgi:ferritin-like metal-binding protein YciE